MLVFSRKKNEAFHIGDDVTVMVLEIRGDKVRLGIKAPASMEVWLAIQKEKRAEGESNE